jgi:hypothetical protein
LALIVKEVDMLKYNYISKTYALALSCLFALLTPNANADLVVTYAEQPGVESSTLSGTSVENFNSLTAGDKYTNLAWTDGTTTVGTFNSVYISAANQYGGATGTGYLNGSNYAVESASVGGANHVAASTLTLTTPSAYFGFWWSAGDANNEVQFFNGSTLVAQFTTATLMDKLPSTYYGNPRSPSTLDHNEPFAFINFYGEGGVTFNSIVFTDTQNSGFEADNYTVRAAAWGTQTGETGAAPGIGLETISGTSVSVIDEPGSMLLVLGGSVGFLGLRGRVKL